MALLGKWFGFSRDEIYDQGIDAYDHGDWEGAIERFETCLDGATDSTMIRLARFHLCESYAQLGTAYLVAGDCLDAARNLCTAVGISSGYPDLYIALARAYAGLGDSERRRLAIEKALDINPKFVDALLEQGILWYEQGLRHEGLRRIRQVVKTDPTLDQSAYRQGLKAHVVGGFKAAAAAFAGIASHESDAGSIRVRLASNYHRERMYEEAAREYAEALQLVPGYADLHCKYGQVLLELDQPEQAIEQFEEALRLNPSYVQAHAYLGVAWARAAHRDKATDQLKRALELDPYNQVALQEVQRLRTA